MLVLDEFLYFCLDKHDKNCRNFLKYQMSEKEALILYMVSTYHIE